MWECGRDYIIDLSIEGATCNDCITECEDKGALCIHYMAQKEHERIMNNLCNHNTVAADREYLREQGWN